MHVLVVLMALLLSVGCSGSGETLGQSTDRLCSSTALTASTSSYRATPGTSVSWTANASCAQGDSPQYRYYVQAPGQPFVMLRDYSPDPNYVWDTTGLSPGQYNWQVWVRSSTASTYETCASRTFTLSSGSSCSTVRITSNADVAHAAGKDVTLTANVSGCSTPEYRWYVRSPGSTSWTLAQDYGPGGATYTFSTVPGTYDVQVWVRQSGSVAPYEAYASYSLMVQGGGVCTSVNVTASAGPFIPTGIPLTLTATAGGCATAEYRWYMRGPGAPAWTVVQDYGAGGSTYTFTTQTGTYEFQAWARKVGSTAAYEAYVAYRIVVAPRPVCTSLSVTASPPSDAEVGTGVQLSPVSSCRDGAEYKVLIHRPGSSEFEVLLESATGNAGMVWDTTGEVPGEYTLQVWARNNFYPLNPDYDLQVTLPYILRPASTFNECAAANSCLPALPATTPPRAEFTGTWSVGNTYVLDASASADDDTPFTGLSYRWDFDDDGTWDAAWTANPVTTHNFPGTGTRQVKVEVRDSCALSTTRTRSIVVGRTPRYVSAGTIASDTWSGLVVISGQVTVGSLSIAAGTHLLFTYEPDANGDGTSGLTVGSLTAAGTADAPIVLSTLGTSARRPRAWTGLVVSDLNASTGITIEYARTGLHAQLQDTANVQGLTVHHSDTGVVVEAAADIASPTFGSVIVRTNVHTGFRLVNMTAALDVEASNNGATGLVLDEFQGIPREVNVVATNNDAGVLYTASRTPNGADATFTGRIYNNRRYGLTAQGFMTAIVRSMSISKNDTGIVALRCAGIDVSASHLDHNRAEAVALAHDGPCAPPLTVKVTEGTIACNSIGYGPRVALTAVAGSDEGSAWTAPNGLKIAFTELAMSTFGSVSSAQLVSPDGTLLWTGENFTLGPNTWAYVGGQTDTVILHGPPELRTSRVLYKDPTATPAQVLLIQKVNTSSLVGGDFSNNYWGNVQPAIFDMFRLQYLTVPGLPADPTQ